MILSSQEIKERILKERLIENFIDLETQLQPASFDLSLDEIYLLTSSASIDFTNKERKLPNYKKIEFINDWIDLSEGIYLVSFNEIVNIPNDLIAFVRPRSSLVRSGATIFSSLWDPGYSGKSNCLLVVLNENGIRIKKNARIAQMVFFKLSSPTTKTYSGIYQKEGIKQFKEES
ncbi:MAG: deoxyuridine 5'-triphosphate nucleotidohydrolase [Candidatus Aenigmarchaeota archaeon]|jgi:dUTP pyrophosphatase|nr:deoxyuridine 5'-triphosphate nucleotidohydrolase [Candidatus Aenigmarchaeota archaeon]